MMEIVAGGFSVPELITMDDFNQMARRVGRKPCETFSEEWFDGTPRKFTKSEDFPAMRAESFQIRLREEARKRGLTMKTSKPDDITVIAHAVNPNGAES